MGLLTGLFQSTVPELPIAVGVITADASAEPGYLYRIVASEEPITITMVALPIDAAANKRFAIKVFMPAPTPPGAELTVYAPAGQLIEADDGQVGAGIVLANQALGTYREWLCDEAGTWMLVGGGWL